MSSQLFSPLEIGGMTIPNRIAVAFAQAVEAGRTAFEVGFGAPQFTASATSPLTGFLDQ